MTFIELEIPLSKLDDFIAWCDAHFINRRGKRFDYQMCYHPNGYTAATEIVQEQAVQIDHDTTLVLFKLCWSDHFRPEAWMRHNKRWNTIRRKALIKGVKP